MEQYRVLHENDSEWRLRKAFLIANKDRFDEDRLICLSNCFINVEMYGTRYPPGVMRILSELAADINDDINEIRQQKKQRHQVKFVKSSDSGNKSSSSISGKNDTKCKTEKLMTKFVKSSDECISNAGSAAASSSGPSGADYWVRNDDAACVVSLNNPDSSVASAPSETPFDLDNTRTSNNRQGLGMPTKSKTKSKKSKKKTENQSKELDEKFIRAKASAKSEEDRKFYLLAEALIEIESDKTNCISLVHDACNRVKMSPVFEFTMDSQSYICDLHIDGVAVARGMGGNKRNAKYDAYTNTITSLKKPYLHVDRVNPEKTELKATDEPPEEQSMAASNSKKTEVGGIMKLGQQQVAARGMKRLHPELNSKNKFPRTTSRAGETLDNFIIMEHASEQSASNILHSSSSFNKTEIEFNRDVFTQQFQMLLNGECVASIVDDDAMPAKTKKALVCTEGLEKLRKTCWTIRIKKQDDVNEEGVSRDEILGEIHKHSEKIQDSNIGSKILKKMGWSGGGIGKDGSGIAEPVKADLTVVNRQGFGLQSEQGVSKDFVENIRVALQKYARSNDENDLSFTSEFSKEERALIHKEGAKFGLKTRSTGTGDDRFLIVSRKRNLSQLVSHIQQSGGSTSKYELLPPSW